MASRKILISLIGFMGIMFPVLASAHEAYVVPTPYFWQQIGQPGTFKAFDALKNTHDLLVTLEVTYGVLALFLLNSLFRRSKAGQKLHASLERLSFLGPILIRVAIASAFFLGIRTNNFLGPELSVQQMLWPNIMRIALYLASGMILFGVFTELAALIGLAVFTVGFLAYGAYLVTYLNYLGELIVLLLFGSRTWSFDRLIFKQLNGWRAAWEKYGTVVVRVFYGIALMYAAVDVKLIHTDLTLRVIRDWNLTQFHWLFPSDPLLIVLGAGLAEFAIGLFIVLGFQMRLTVLISLFYITLSLLYFRELVWPHILLYGISLNLLIQPEYFTLDRLLFRRQNPVPS